MSDSLTLFLATSELILFFSFDFLFAKVLNALKQDHPELDECAPEDSPDLDPVAVIESLRHTAVELYDQHQQARTQTDAPTPHSRTPYEPLDPPTPPNAASIGRENALHNCVVLCGFLAPVAALLEVMMPAAFGWCRFAVPAWIAMFAVIPGMAAVLVFTARALGAAALTEVNRQQWIALMWFRLDFMCIMSGVAFFGAGAWFVTLCMVAVAFYLAHRVMRIEKRLAHLTRETQLVRGEVDTEHVYAPGTAEAARAMASSDVQGYNALNS